MRPALPFSSTFTELAAVGTLVIFSVLLAACGSGDDQASSETVAVTGTESQISLNVVQAIEASLDIPTSELIFRDPEPLEPSSCTLHRAWQDQVLDAPVISFAELPDESVLRGPEVGAAQLALDICFDQAGIALNANSVAAIVLGLDISPTQIQLLTPSMASFLEPYDAAYEPPTLVQSGDSTVTTFFANDFQVVGVVQVTATRASDGTLTVDYAELSSTLN